MDLASVRRAYHRHAPYYDAVFGTLLGRGRKQAVRQANRLACNTVLEVGVGTGLSLPRYRPDYRIVGIDISPDMLAKAHERVADLQLGNVEALLEMDAENLEFADNTFEMVVAMFVVSVVPHPDKLLSEMQRVCVPGGDILVVNHFAHTNGLRGAVERKLAPLSRHLGWRPDFRLDPHLEGTSLEVLDTRHTDPFGMFTLVHYRNAKKTEGEPG